MHSTIHIEIEESQMECDVPFGEERHWKIINRVAIVAIDASIKNNKIGGCWIITDEAKSVHAENRLYHKE